MAVLAALAGVLQHPVRSGHDRHVRHGVAVVHGGEVAGEEEVRERGRKWRGRSEVLSC